MSIFDNVKSGVSNAVETLSDTAQALIEKNRVHAQKNRIKTVIQCENRVIDKAFIELGKYYMKNLRDPENEKNEELCHTIEESIEKIKLAKERYDKLTAYEESICVCPCYGDNASYEEDESDSDDIEDITLACSNEDDYDVNPFDEAAAARAEKLKAVLKDESEKEAAEKETEDLILEDAEEAATAEPEPTITRDLSPDDEETADDLSF